MAEAPVHPAMESAEALLSGCKMERVRRSGPGGQHRNKVESGIVLVHRATGVAAEASERRSQAENRREALWRLRVNLALAERTNGSYPPTPLWRSRCVRGKLSVNAAHDDFPALLAEALDAVHRHDADVRAAAGALGCTATQLVRFLKLEPRALSQVNQKRLAAGLHRLV